MNIPRHTLQSLFISRVAVGLVLSTSFVELTFAQTAQPQAPWVWINASGVKTFSDVAPPAGTSDKKILSRPGQFANTAAGSASAAAAASSAPQARTAAAAASVPRASSKDPELEKRLTAEEAAKKTAELAALDAEEAKQKAKMKTACTQMRGTAAGLRSGGRIATTNAKGEREFMSDEARAAALRKVDNNLAECAQDGF